MVSDLELLADMHLAPAGFRPESDRTAVTTGVVLGYDASSRLATVAVAGGEGALIRAAGDVDWAAIASAEDEAHHTCYVLRDQRTGASLLAVAPVNPPASPALPGIARVTAIQSAGFQVTVVDADGDEFTGTGMQTYTSPAVGDVVGLSWAPDGTLLVLGRIGTDAAAPATPTAPSVSRAGGTVTIAWTMPDGARQMRRRVSSNGGSTWSTSGWTTATSATAAIGQGQTLLVQVQAQNSVGTSAWSTSASTTWPAPTPSLVTRTITIRPHDSATYRVPRAAWDRWNVDRYGGASTLYQGDGYGSGQLIGAAFYGDQIVRLGAEEIVSITVLLRGAGLAAPSFPAVTVRGITNGTRPGGAPTQTGGTATAAPGQSGTARAALPDLNAWRTGAIRGLATVGAGYAAVRGTSAADGMALDVTYRVRQ